MVDEGVEGQALRRQDLTVQRRKMRSTMAFRSRSVIDVATAHYSLLLVVAKAATPRD